MDLFKSKKPFTFKKDNFLCSYLDWKKISLILRNEDGGIITKKKEYDNYNECYSKVIKIQRALGDDHLLINFWKNIQKNKERTYLIKSSSIRWIKTQKKDWYMQLNIELSDVLMRPVNIPNRYKKDYKEIKKEIEKIIKNNNIAI